MDAEYYITTWAATLVLLLARVAGMVMVAPVFSSRAVPLRLRYMISAVIALAAAGRLGSPVSAPAGAGEFVAGVVCEAFLGVAMGYAVRLVFVGIELGAVHTAYQLGLGIGEVFEPFAEEISGPMRRLFYILAIVLFLAVGGHRALLSGLMKTFTVIPPLDYAGATNVLNIPVTVMGAAFALGLKVAAPVMVAMLLATATMGFVQRTMPQCNILSTGLPIRAALGMLVLAAAVAAMAPLMESAVDMVFDNLAGLTGPAGGG